MCVFLLSKIVINNLEQNDSRVRVNFLCVFLLSKIVINNLEQNDFRVRVIFCRFGFEAHTHS
jgi:hypothetical protein